MKTGVVLLLLLPTLAFAAEGDGRYQLHQDKEAIMVDSKTGKAWILQKTGEVLGFVPLFYSLGDYKFSIYPSSYSLTSFTLPSSNSDTH